MQRYKKYSEYANLGGIFFEKVESHQRGYGLRVTGYGLQVTGYGLRITDYGLRVTGYGLRVTGYRLREGESGQKEEKGGQLYCPETTKEGEFGTKFVI